MMYWGGANSCQQSPSRASTRGFHAHHLAQTTRAFAAVIAVAGHLLEWLPRQVEPDSPAETRAGILLRHIGSFREAAEKRIQVLLSPLLVLDLGSSAHC